MKAVVWTGNRQFELHQVSEPEIQSQQVLVKVKAASICTSDFHYDDYNCVPPIIPGHEIAGIVHAVGAGVVSFQVGQRVTLDPVQRCGQCRCCQDGIEHLCLNVRHLGGTGIPGGWAEYVAIDAQNAYPIPESISFEQAALTEPAAVCLESFQRARFKNGQTVVIMGDGTFGFIHAMFARILGAQIIIVAGHYPERLSRIAKNTGAIICNTHDEPLDTCLNKMGIDSSVDLVIEATGSRTVPNTALNVLRPQGVLILFSYIWDPEPLDLGLIHMKELNVLGACRSSHCFEKCLELMDQGLLDPGELIDIEAPLQEVGMAMKLLVVDKKNRFKAVLIP